MPSGRTLPAIERGENLKLEMDCRLLPSGLAAGPLEFAMAVGASGRRTRFARLGARLAACAHGQRAAAAGLLPERREIVGSAVGGHLTEVAAIELEEVAHFLQ